MSGTASSDASLRSLEASAGALVPGFWGGRMQFSVAARHGVQTTTVTATPTDAGAGLRVNGVTVRGGECSPPLDLLPGRNVVTVEVTAADGATHKTYEVKVIRDAAAPNWVKRADSAPWAARDSAGELVFDGHMWLFGGYTPDLLSDVWKSRDGVNWTQVGSIPAEAGINIPVTFVLNGRMFVGSQDGRLFSSADGAAWELAAERAPWSGRYAAGAAVFRGRAWVVGGSGGGRLFNDVWSSADGADWTLEVAEAPWSRRQVFGNLVVHRDLLWLIGGGVTAYQPFKAYRDVWCSPDGRAWTKVADEAPWPARIWSSCAVYRDRIWLLGGFRAQPSWTNFNDLWHSEDGAEWRRLDSESVWEARHEISAYVFNDRLWVIGGNAWPLKNDAWQLQIPGLSFVSQPVIEEVVTAEYRYRAYAEFGRGGGRVRYRLAEAPPWLGIDADTGLVRGTPPATGDFRVAVSASDAAGETARQEYTLHVIPLG